MVQNIDNKPPGQTNSDGTTVTPKGGKGIAIGVILAIAAIGAVVLYVLNQAPPA